MLLAVSLAMLFTVGLAKKSLPVVEAPVGWCEPLALHAPSQK
jgi:hypothetical protein